MKNLGDFVRKTAKRTVIGLGILGGVFAVGLAGTYIALNVIKGVGTYFELKCRVDESISQSNFSYRTPQGNCLPTTDILFPKTSEQEGSRYFLR